VCASLVALVGPAVSSADIYADEASVIACPPGPAGWSVPPGPDGRFVLTPLSLTSQTATTNVAYGGTQVNVDCTYVSSAGGRLTVTVRYALPKNFNPFADFYIGCGTNKTGIGGPTGPKPWDTKDRQYRILSPVAWSYATFFDFYAQLKPDEVGAFESIARTMLKSSESVAHDCNLKVEPTPPQVLWSFGFNANVTNAGVKTTGGTTGSFLTRPNQAGGTGSLGSLSADDIVLKLTKGKKSIGSVTLKVTSPVSFKYSYGATLRALVEVKSSTYTPCRTGATGTLIVSTNTRTATLQVCHRNLIQGNGTLEPRISSLG
jgi:hypothetical protein